MLNQPQLKPSYNVEKLNDQTLLLVSETEGLILTNPIANAVLAEIAHHQPTKDELIAKLSAKGIALFEVMQVLLQLEQAGYITENNTFFSPEQAAYWESLGFNLGHLTQVLQHKSVG